MRPGRRSWFQRLAIATLVLGALALGRIAWLAAFGVATVDGTTVPLSAYTSRGASVAGVEWRRAVESGDVLGLDDEEAELVFPVPGVVQLARFLLITFVMTGEVTRSLVDDELKRQEFARRQLSVSDEEVDRDLAYRRINGEYAQAMARGTTPAAFREEMRGWMAESRLRASFGQALSPTPGDVRAHYESHPEWRRRPEEFRVRRILVAQEALAQRLRDEIVRGADFATLARRHSLNLGWQRPGGEEIWWSREPRGRYSTELVPHDRVIFALRTGEVSRPVKIQNGWWIVQVVERHPAGPAPFSRVAARIKRAIERERTSQAFKRWFVTRRQEARIRYAWGFTPF